MPAYYVVSPSQVVTADYYVLVKPGHKSKPKPKPKPSPYRVMEWHNHHGSHHSGERIMYNHKYHSYCALVKNETGRTLPADEVRGILNSSTTALSSRDLAMLTIIKSRRGGYKVVKG